MRHVALLAVLVGLGAAGSAVQIEGTAKGGEPPQLVCPLGSHELPRR